MHLIVKLNLALFLKIISQVDEEYQFYKAFIDVSHDILTSMLEWQSLESMFKTNRVHEN